MKSKDLLKIVFPKVNCKYGAPMGRCDCISEKDLQNSFYLHELPMSGAYDVGGAYWGYGAPIFIAYCEGKNEMQRVFVRAKNRAEAWEEVKKVFKNSELKRGIK